MLRKHVHGKGAIARILGRIQYGWTPREFAHAAAVGPERYLRSQLDHEAIEDAAVPPSPAGMSATTPVAKIMQIRPQETVNAFQEFTLVRAISSRRQLFERMVEFWGDHLYISLMKRDCRWLKAIDDREVIRAHAMGKFGDMLQASAKSPAMLDYLDARYSVASGPNQNYARELMELHTIGSGFTQKDVEEVSRCFTGWTYIPEQGTFVFDSKTHDNGSKRVLGVDIPANGGVRDGELVLKMLAEHPATARTIAVKLGRYFYGSDAPAAVVDSAAKKYLATGGSIREVVKAVLDVPALLNAPPKLKRPRDLFVGMIRALQPAIADTSGLQEYLEAAGHLPYRWEPPDGYPDTFEYWSSALLPRWNFGFALVQGGVRGLQLAPAPLTSGARTLPELIPRINAQIFGGGMTPGLVEKLSRYARSHAFTGEAPQELYGLALASPEYQYC